MPDWESIDPKLHEWTAEGLNPVEMCRRLGWDRKKRQTMVDRLRKLGLYAPVHSKPTTTQEMPMSEETVEVLPGEISIEDANTAPPEVHYGAVNEFLALPEGYAKVIQPMREYTEAEDEALKESVRLFGFIGTIVRDQYGRILDGNQRQRVARWFGKGCPFTITEVRDDAHAIEIANQLNLARRHFTPEQRQQIAASLREQGRSYRYHSCPLKAFRGIRSS